MSAILGRAERCAPTPTTGPTCTVLTVRHDGAVCIVAARWLKDGAYPRTGRWIPENTPPHIIGWVDGQDPNGWQAAGRLAIREGWQMAGDWTLAGRYPARRVTPGPRP